MNLRSLYKKFVTELEGIYQEEESKQIFSILMESEFGWSKIDLRLNDDHEFTDAKISKLEDVLARLRKFEPIQYVLGCAWFAGMKLKVSSDVLIPRQETEELVDWVIKENSSHAPSIWDFCSGSGCIALALKKNIPNSQVKGFDISDGALEVARFNSTQLNLPIEFIQADILTSNFVENHLDIVISNPPYVRKSESIRMHENVLKFEPHLALFVTDEDPLIFYRQIGRLAQQVLKPNGQLFLEINENLGEETVKLLEHQGFHGITLRKDLNDRNRMIQAFKK